MPTLKELAVLYAKKQPKQVDNITNDAPILGAIPFEQASHDLWNVYEEVNEITGAGFVDLDAVLPEVGIKSELKKIDLSIMGGEASVGEDKARMYGGAPAYFAKQEPSILRKSGMATEYALLYNGFRAYALNNAKKIDAGGSGNTNHCILAVHFIPGETTGLYSPKGFSNGSMLNVQALNGGNLMKVKATRNGVEVEVNGYAVRYKGYFGLQLGNVNSVAGIFNIDRISSTKKLPTATMIDDLCDLVRAGSNTFLFMHPKTKSAINSLKTNALQTLVGDSKMNTTYEAWNGVPILTSYNFLDGTETKVSFA